MSNTKEITPMEKRPPMPDKMHSYWCETCKSWTLFQFEDFGMCDDCAMDLVMSDDVCTDLDGFYDDELVALNYSVNDHDSLAEQLRLSQCREERLRELLVEARGYLDRLTQEGIRNRIDEVLAYYSNKN